MFFWFLTELEDCSSQEAIILYRRRTIAIKFKSTMIDDKDKECLEKQVCVFYGTVLQETTGLSYHSWTWCTRSDGT
ncbi:uncharacterized protein FTOL_04026 [Fusarium torulosum]|uniref:Uncharacterized protein n=1 Tax=Fusarium torulosum TaxID=33205 RepID=A0AAE8SG56_9HYPO|nr:uncharacterized protein FTOL_04026 [Fusarium torulosum]